MPTFVYTAIDSAGTTVEGTNKADTLGDTRAWLHGNNLYAISIKERRRKVLDFELTASKLSKRELMHFSRRLACVREGRHPDHRFAARRSPRKPATRCCVG